VIQSEFFEVLQVLRQVPGQLAVPSYDTVGRHGNDGAQIWKDDGTHEVRMVAGR